MWMYNEIKILGTFALLNISKDTLYARILRYTTASNLEYFYDFCLVWSAAFQGARRVGAYAAHTYYSDKLGYRFF